VVRLSGRLAVVGLLALAGCSSVNQVTVPDFAAAEAIATAAGPPGDAACWAQWVAMAKAEPSGGGGVATLIATKRTAQAALGSPTCLSISTQLLGELLKASSPQGAALGAVIGF
jgi:hypothetical protein